MKPALEKPINLRLPRDLKRDIEKLARENGLAIVSQIRMLLTKGLSDGKRPLNKRFKAG